MIPLPGHIIPVADSLLAGREVGGRISTAAGRVVTLDRDTQAKPGDRLIINLPGGRVEGRTVQSVNKRAVTVTTNYSEAPLPQLQWALGARGRGNQESFVTVTKKLCNSLGSADQKSNPRNEKALNNQGFVVHKMAEAMGFELMDLLQSTVFKTAMESR